MKVTMTMTTSCIITVPGTVLFREVLKLTIAVLPLGADETVEAQRGKALAKVTKKDFQGPASCLGAKAPTNPACTFLCSTCLLSSDSSSLQLLLPQPHSLRQHHNTQTFHFSHPLSCPRFSKTSKELSVED